MDSYTPCRTTELYRIDGEFITIMSVHGEITLTGAKCKIWILSDGKHTIQEITNQVLGFYGNQKSNIVRAEVIDTLLFLQERSLVVTNWDPLYKQELQQLARKQPLR